MSKVANFKVMVMQWSKKHKKELIALVLLAWLILFIINMILKNQAQKIDPPSTSYAPYKLIYSHDDEVVPEETQKNIENLLDKYFNYCNEGEYEEAYKLITSECKKKLYPSFAEFKGYVDYVFQGKKKIYNIQSLSSVGNKYIYNVRILDDILANGTTDGYYYYEEKFILIEDNGEMKLSIGEYVGDEKLNIRAEDDNMIFEIQSKSVDYETETYTIKITNKTDKYIVISDNTQNNEIILDLGEQTRRPADMEYLSIYVKPNSMTVQEIKFNKFYDNGLKANRLILGNVRILNSYDSKTGTTQADLDSAIKIYGYEIKID
ncbi:hypothetical protein [Candidatus Ruminimicrobium bovinum]|uniref:hypothetical protein n=1 Tax=Candidatus Ruminimicrobium bovinum TaxID=3242779 RepID=UPI0039B940AB